MESTYKATLQIWSTIQGHAILQLEFDEKTVEILRDEISGNSGESALLKFTIEARSNGVKGKISAVFKGAVALVHQMPLNLTFQSRDQCIFLVEVHKFSRTTETFSCFFEKGGYVKTRKFSGIKHEH